MMIAAAIQTIEVWLIALVITVVVLSGFGMFARWCALGPAVRQKKLDQLRVGMNADEVTALLGPPRQSRLNHDGVRQWLYGATMKRHVLLIEFNTHGRVESFAHGVPQAKRSGDLPPWSAKTPPEV